ncbi:transmembrane protein 72 [Podarcis raffonei]|uniref:transmembrane protein 72 n=1 Tax=Podarcis raffonei TaxID=65483 RepID=UPI0023298FD8|nr:transmembrane protein 72 [Podarcis raffonei]
MMFLWEGRGSLTPGSLHLSAGSQSIGLSQEFPKAQSASCPANMKQAAFWNTLEYTCRLLGISTGAVLIGVGTDTLLLGQFKSLAVYLLVSGIAVSLCEAAYFAGLLLTACCTPKTGSGMHTCWKHARRRGAFQKFLMYVLLSVACFLHPVIVWHVTIPGTMLVVTGFTYFLLSKQQKETRTPGEEQYTDSQSAAVAMTDAGDTEQTYTFPRGAPQGQRNSLLGFLRSFFKSCKKLDTVEASSSSPPTRRQVHFEEKVVNIILSVKESPEDQESLAEETTSDMAPILPPQL